MTKIVVCFFHRGPFDSSAFIVNLAGFVTAVLDTRCYDVLATINMLRFLLYFFLTLSVIVVIE